MASYDKVIPPGGEGRITLKVNTKGYQGKISKGARVYTNDPKKAFFVLRLTAFVKVPIHVSPRYVYLVGRSDQAISRTVYIEAREERPLELTPIEFTLNGKVNFTTQALVPGRKYSVHLATAPGFSGPLRGVLKFKTNYPEKPEILIKIRGRIRAPKGSRPKPPSPPKSPKVEGVE